MGVFMWCLCTNFVGGCVEYWSEREKWIRAMTAYEGLWREAVRPVFEQGTRVLGCDVHGWVSWSGVHVPAL